MRREIFLAWALGVAAVGCSDEDPMEGGERDAGRPDDAADSAHRDSGPRRTDASPGKPDAGSVVNPDLGPWVNIDPSELTGATLALGKLVPRCDFSTLMPGSCGVADPLEPNDENAPKDIALTDGCYALGATLASPETSDGLRWTNPKRDPVQVGLAYTAASGSTSDLDFRVKNATGGQEALNQVVRSTTSEDARSVVSMSASGIYTVDIYDSVKDCQPYKLSIDANWCTDGLEDNDTDKQATQLDLAANAHYDVTANMVTGDSDFFRFVNPRRDPVLVAIEYTAGVDDKLDIDLEVRDANGAQVLRDGESRTTADELISYWIKPTEAAAVFFVELSAAGNGCVPYKLTVDRNLCSDKYEDNDVASAAKPIPANTVVAAKSLNGDDDYYDISAYRSGSCTLRFEGKEGSTADLTLTAYDAAGRELASDSTGASGATPTARLDLSSVEATTISVVAAKSGRCVTYNLRCDARLPM